MQQGRGRLLVAAVLATAVSFGVRANAQVTVQTFTVPNGTTSPFTQSFTFNKFNKTIGTLNSITLALQGSLLANIDIFNTNSSSNGYTGVNSGIHLGVSGPGSQSEAFALFTPSLSGTAAPGETQLNNQSDVRNGTDNVPFVDFGFYSASGGGTGTLTGQGLDLTFNGTATGSNTQNVTFTGNGTAGEVITLTYNFTPTIPEPGAITFLVAGAFGGLGALVRRRRKL